MKYLFILLTIFFCHNLMAKDYSLAGLDISPLYYWVEPEDKVYTVEEAEAQADWIPTDRELNFGYEHQTLWFSQDLIAHEKGDWVFQITYPLLDYLDLYLFKDDRLIREIHTGDSIPFSQKLIKVQDFILSVSASERSQFRLVGRVHTEGTLLLPIEWKSEIHYAEDLAINQMIYGFYYGVLFIMALYHLFIYSVVKERSYLYYVASVCAFIFLQLTFDGRGFTWLWPEMPEINNFSFPLAYGLHQIVILSFMGEFLKLKDNHRVFYWFFSALRVFVLGCITALFFLPYSSVVPILVLSGLVGLLSSLLCCAYLWSKGVQEARYFTCAWLMFLLGILLLNLRGLGYGETNVLSQYGYLFGSILEVLFLAFSLADRIRSVNVKRMAVERALIKSQASHVEALQRYQELYETSPIGNFQADNKQQLISVNKACARLFGFSQPEEMLAEVKNINNYLKSDMADFMAMVKESRKSGGVFDWQIHIQDHMNKERWLSIGMRFNNSDGVEVYEGSVQDVTERKNSEKLRLELDRERMHIMEQFSIGIGKEINTPLGSNVATTSFVRESLDDIYQKQEQGTVSHGDYEGFVKLSYQSMGLLESNQKRITKVVKRFSEVSGQHMGLQESHFVLADVLNETIESQRWKMAGWRVNMICSREIQLHNYSKAISTIITQLIDNALVHSNADDNQDPKIWLRVDKNKDDELSITFSDNGQGIKKEMSKNLCQPFFTTKRGPDGHIGLGLYMVYNLVTRSLNGRILFPISGRGFSVQFKFPTDVTGHL